MWLPYGWAVAFESPSCCGNRPPTGGPCSGGVLDRRHIPSTFGVQSAPSVNPAWKSRYPRVTMMFGYLDTNLGESCLLKLLFFLKMLVLRQIHKWCEGDWDLNGLMFHHNDRSSPHFTGDVGVFYLRKKLLCYSIYSHLFDLYAGLAPFPVRRVHEGSWFLGIPHPRNIRRETAQMICLYSGLN